MTAPTDAGMVELIERLEKATGPDRALDYAIDQVVFDRAPNSLFTPKHTVSIDAALSLLPEGYALNIETSAAQGVGSHLVYANVWHDTPEYDGVPGNVSRAPTIALALCASCLKARQSLRTRSPA